MTAWGSRNEHFKVLASIIRKQRDEAITKQRFNLNKRLSQLNISESKKTRILNADVEELVTSLELVLIFATRCATIGLEYCLITEDNFDQAIQKAEQCDQIRKVQKLKNWTPKAKDSEETFGPFFGIPMSIKDSIDLKGFSSTLGVTWKYQHKEERDGLIVSILKNSGIIPFVKSNVPQLVITYETTNPLWGRALNPWDKKRTTGGSSGGQGGLICSGCSPLGIGSDLGGSVRIPAEFCGIYALKPNSQRLSFKGHALIGDTFDGQINIKPTLGPMGKSVQDLARFMKIATTESYYDSKLKDPYHKIILFDYQQYQNTCKKKLRIGYFETLQLIEPTPATIRAVREVKSVLEKQGHQVVKIQFPNQRQLVGLFYEFVSAEGDFLGFKEALRGQALINQYKTVKNIAVLPNFVKRILVFIMSKLQPRLGYLLTKANKKSAYQYLKLSFEQAKYKQRFQKLWAENELDFILAPGFGSQAQLITYSERINTTAAYTFIWNIFDMVAGSMPITVVRPDQQYYNSVHNDQITTKLKQNVQGTAGLPVGIQIIGLPYQEERVLGLMKFLEQRFPFAKTHKYPI